jgi:hypothetical protein
MMPVLGALGGEEDSLSPLIIQAKNTKELIYSVLK